MLGLYQGVYDRDCGYSRLTFSGQAMEYWERSLFQRLCALFDISGYPQEGKNQSAWDLDSFYYGLWAMGYFSVFKSRTYGIQFQPSTPAGIGLNFQPTGLTVNTPYFQFPRPLIIGEECVAFKLTPDYRGVWDIVSKYATELTYMDVALRQSELNARFAYAITAPSKQAEATAEAMMERLANGETAIVVDPRMGKVLENGEWKPSWQQFDRDLKQNFILPDLIESRRQLMDDFYREIGIRTSEDKKERVITTEQRAKEAAGYNRRRVWERTMQQSVDRYNEFFGERMSVKWKGDEEIAAITQQDIRSVQPYRGNNRSTGMG